MSLIIDAHTHVKHGDKDHTEVPAERVIAQMGDGGVDWSVIFSICEPSAASHERVLREWRKFPDRLIPFAHGLPLEGEAGQAEVRRAVEELGFAGVKVHFGEFSIERGRLPCTEEVLPLFGTIAELGVPAAVDVGGAVDVAAEIVDALPDLKFILAHLGHPRDPATIGQAIDLCRVRGNMWMDCSYCFVPEKIPEAVRTCGAHKIILGSDGPWEQISVPALIEQIRSLDLPGPDTEAILGGNMGRLLAGLWDFGV